MLARQCAETAVQLPRHYATAFPWAELASTLA